MARVSTMRRSKAVVRRASVGLVLVGCGAWIAILPALATESAAPLGTADSFAVLAGSGITNTGPTTITGDIGSYPTPTITGAASITLNGTNHAGDAVTQGAKDDLLTAYNDAAGRSPATSVPVELGGTRLLGGVYTSPTFGLTGTLTLDSGGDPDATFVFQAGSTLITEVNSRVLLVGVDPCHVVWQVGSSATFKTGTEFAGDVLAHTSITAQTQATFRGRLLAMNGAVTLDTNTITRASCVASASTTTTTAPPATTTTTAPPATTSPPATTPPAQTVSAPETPAPAAPAVDVEPAATAAPIPTPVATAPAPSAAVAVPAPAFSVTTAAPVARPVQTTSSAARPGQPPTLASTGADGGRLTWTGLWLIGIGLGITIPARRYRLRLPADTR